MFELSNVSLSFYCNIYFISSLGLDLYLFYGASNRNEVFVLIRASIDRLRTFADDIDFQMLLDAQGTGMTSTVFIIQIYTLYNLSLWNSNMLLIYNNIL